MNNFPALSKDQIRALSSDEFRKRLKGLEDEFSRISREIVTPLAVAIKQTKEGCPHTNNETRPCARFCFDCGEYYNVDTSFSPRL
jgi:hypothetical protein